LLLPLFLACVVAGGFLAGRYTGRGWLGGAQVGLISGLVNLLVLGGLLGGNQPNEIHPSAIGWIPGFVIFSSMLGWAGAIYGSRKPRQAPESSVWVGWLARVAVGATLLLLAVGGLVTSYGAGLAVVDWPNSYGYNMFLFPLSRMTGGVYYEHAHRLFGALVGLTTLVLAGVLQRRDERPWVRWLGWIALATVMAQGVVGGLRVTGRFTMSGSLEKMLPNVTLAVVHGVMAQIFLGIMVGLAVFTSRSWMIRKPLVYRASARTDRVLCTMLVLLLVAQIVMGAFQRHMARGLMVHISMAVAVLIVAVVCGARARGRLEPALRYLGHAVMDGTILQLALGAVAFVATSATFAGDGTTPLRLIVATAHQWCGAVLLGCAVMLMLWTYRLLPARAEA